MSVYSPYETLTIFQSIAHHGTDAAAIALVATALRQNQHIVNSDDGRFSIDALAALLQESDGDRSPKRRKLDDENYVGPFLDKLYLQYKSQAVGAIKADEDTFASLSDEIRALEKQLEAESKPAPVPAHRPGPFTPVTLTPVPYQSYPPYGQYQWHPQYPYYPQQYAPYPVPYIQPQQHHQHQHQQQQQQQQQQRAHLQPQLPLHTVQFPQNPQQPLQAQQQWRGSQWLPQAAAAVVTPVSKPIPPPNSGSSTPWKSRQTTQKVRPDGLPRPEREVSPLTDREESPAPPVQVKAEPATTPLSGPPTSFITVSKSFAKTAQLLLNEITSHKLAGIFAKPLSERDAPGYKDLILRPQDLKSIKSAVSKGGRAALAAIEAADDAPHGTSFYLVAKTLELVPPRGIVNSSQLEMELVRMFANAVMFNLLPSSEPEDGIISDAREMFGDVVEAVGKWRELEIERRGNHRHASPSASSAAGESEATGTPVPAKKRRKLHE